MVLISLGNALAMLGSRTGDRALLVRGLTHQETALADTSLERLGTLGAVFTSLKDSLQTARALVGEAPDLMPEHTPAPSDAPAYSLFLSAMTASVRYSASRDPADLNVAIGELEQVRERVRQGQSPRIAAHALWTLAEDYRERLSHTRDPAARWTRHRTGRGSRIPEG